jgi:hypothetical protein
LAQLLQEDTATHFYTYCYGLRFHTRHQKKKYTKKSRISPPTPGFKVVSILFLCSFLVAMCHVVVIKLFTVLDDIPI